MEGRDALLKDSHLQRNDSIQKCALAAKVRGYQTFALQDGGMCVGSPRAHKTFGKYGKSQDCKNDGKGGPWANQVYNLIGTMEGTVILILILYVIHSDPNSSYSDWAEQVLQQRFFACWNPKLCTCQSSPCVSQPVSQSVSQSASQPSASQPPAVSQ